MSVNVTEDGIDFSDNVTTGMDYNITTIKPSISRIPHPRLIQLFTYLKEQCDQKLASQERLTDEVFCEGTPDRFGGCWPDTKAGTIAKINCPDIPGFNPQEYAYKECTINGTWYEKAKAGYQWSNYTQCRSGTVTMEEDPKYIYIFIGGYSLSLVLLIISLAIFFHFKQLRCDRITIHKNLFISYTLTGISWILYYVLVALDGNVIVNNPLWCRMQHVLCQYFLVCNFLWMFCEGLYLNTIMVYAFSSGKTLIICCYVIGWFVPSILTTIYAVVRSKDPQESLDCWFHPSSLQWIMYGPIVFSIVVNALFLINIVRLLITKLRQLPEATQTRKATRATLILVPLLGLQYLLTPIKPPQGHPLDEFYHVTLALIISLQGAFVSIMYCFCNGEVVAVLSRKYTQHRLMRKRSSVKSNSGHAITAYTTTDHVSHHTNQANLSKENSHERHLMEVDTA